MNSIKAIVKFLIDRVIFGISKYLFPVKNIILFESFSDYCDNSKTVFLELINQNKNEDYQIYWFVENPEVFKAKKIKNVKFIKINYTGWKKIWEELRNFYLISSSKYFFYTHRNFARTRPKNNQQIINLTHGTSLKDTKGIHPSIRYNSITTVTSQLTKKLRVKSYDGGMDQMEITGLPRNDFLFEGLNDEEKTYFNLDHYESFLFWMPTFRRQKGKNRNDTGTTAQSDIPLITEDDEWEKINTMLTNKNSLLMIKPHPAQKMEYIEKVDLSNIKLITNEELNREKVDLYKLLGESDALISDYSSIFIDYLLLDKPIAFTIDDFNAYKDNLGFSVSNPLDYMAGHKMTSAEDLIEFIEDVTNKRDKYSDERNHIKDKFHFYKDDKSTDRVLDSTKI